MKNEPKLAIQHNMHDHSSFKEFKENFNFSLIFNYSLTFHWQFNIPKILLQQKMSIFRPSHTLSYYCMDCE